MRSTIVIVMALLLTVYATAQISAMYRAKSDLDTFVQRTLDFVDETAKESVKTDIVQAAHKLGIEVETGNIDVVYEDSDVPTIPQRFVSRLGAQFINKRVVISLRYVAHVLGLPVHQQVTASKIRQVAAPVLHPNKTTQELLDSP